MRIHFRCSLSRVLALTFLLLTPVLHAQVAVYFTLPEQPLADSLRAVGTQTNTSVVFDPALVEGRRAPALDAQMSLDQALSRLLVGTGLAHQFLNERTVVLASTKDVESKASVVGSAVANRIQLVEAAAQESADRDRSQIPVSKSSAAQSSAEIVVTGSHIRGQKEVANPSLTITREQIEQTGYATLERFMESLPQNFTGVGRDVAVPNSGGSVIAFANYADQASAVDLRGIGPEATLTLLNGTRRANSIGGQVVDMSTIPLSVIERVEVLTGGNSAVYGSDAVAGVVNLVTRRDFDGAQSQAQYGWSEQGGGEQLQLSTIAGKDFGRGGFVAAYDYLRELPLNLVDTNMVISPTPQLGWIPVRTDIVSASRRHSLFLSGRYSVSERMEFYGDGLYTARKLESINEILRVPATNVSFNSMAQDTDQYSVSGGLRAHLNKEWTVQMTGATSVADFDSESNDRADFGTGLLFNQTFIDSKYQTNSLSAVANGPLPSIGGWVVQAALGAEVRDEKYRNVQLNNGVPLPSQLRDGDRNISSVFTEFSLPLIANGERRGLRRIDMSLAARYDDYSDFGSTFNPQGGLIWQLSEGFKLRGSYARAFRAPSLVQLSNAGTNVQFRRFADPASNTGTAYVLMLLSDGNTALGPEKASSWSTSMDWQPQAAPWLKTSVSYYEVEYKDRITRPMQATDVINMFFLQSQFAQILNRNPTQAQVDAAMALDADGSYLNASGVVFNPATQNPLTVLPGMSLADNRISNVAIQNLRGMDLQLDASFQTGIGALNMGFNGSYTLNHERHVTRTSPGVSSINEVGKPTDFRLRANMGWSRGAFGVYAYVNYIDDYTNPFSTPRGKKMDAWTTGDVTLRVDGSKFVSSNWLSTMEMTLSVNNVLNAEPPEFADEPFGVRYDSANADPFGRQFSLRLLKNW